MIRGGPGSGDGQGFLLRVEERLNVFLPGVSYTRMMPRWFAVLLSLFLAAPLCCCGWHQALAEAEVSCPMCQESDGSGAEEEGSCLCTRELIQRDVAPKAIKPAGPGSSFAILPETLVGQFKLVGLMWSSEERFRVAVRSGGPPRWYLKHRALLC